MTRAPARGWPAGHRWLRALRPRAASAAARPDRRRRLQQLLQLFDAGGDHRVRRGHRRFQRLVQLRLERRDLLGERIAPGGRGLSLLLELLDARGDDGIRRGSGGRFRPVSLSCVWSAATCSASESRPAATVCSSASSVLTLAASASACVSAAVTTFFMSSSCASSSCTRPVSSGIRAGGRLGLEQLLLQRVAIRRCGLQLRLELLTRRSRRIRSGGRVGLEQLLLQRIAIGGSSLPAPRAPGHAPPRRGRAPRRARARAPRARRPSRRTRREPPGSRAAAREFRPAGRHLGQVGGLLLQLCTRGVEVRVEGGKFGDLDGLLLRRERRGATGRSRWRPRTRSTGAAAGARRPASRRPAPSGEPGSPPSCSVLLSGGRGDGCEGRSGMQRRAVVRAAVRPVLTPNSVRSRPPCCSASAFATAPGDA